MTQAEISKTVEEYKKKQSGTCPLCGYCEHCGRSNYSAYPLYPVYPVPQYPQWPWIVYTGISL